MQTDKHTIFSAWAPLNSPWSRWAKPAIFSHLPAELEIPPTLEVPFASVAFPPARANHAVVVDLPGPQAVAAGLALARAGYRPVPLFNSCPPSPDDTLRMTSAAVDARSVLEALTTGAQELAALPLPVDAPPAFLLDLRRGAPGVIIAIRTFDNRSVVFASDFPSANFLRTQGIHQARLIHDYSFPIGDDLRYALRHWPTDGVSIEAVSLSGDPFPLTWPRDGILGEMIERLKAMMALRRNPAGGFGRLVPESSGG